MALDLRQKNLDQQLSPAATSTLIGMPGPPGKDRLGKLHLDVGLAADDAESWENSVQGLRAARRN